AGEGPAAARRLRAELRRIERRDFFPPPERATARAAVGALTAVGDPAGAPHATRPAMDRSPR
ncbi:MAG TPA: hypothetical protein VGD67_01715, partial [Pseudonocardiaceae bacterium]